ncbi:MAG TPA: hypothetical protein VGJ00_03530 [Rhabdochlamydiaceae bacterium]|jgi:hypothetical protein
MIKKLITVVSVLTIATFCAQNLFADDAAPAPSTKPQSATVVKPVQKAPAAKPAVKKPGAKKAANKPAKKGKGQKQGKGPKAGTQKKK